MPVRSQSDFTVLSPLDLDHASNRLADAVASPGMGRALHDLRPFVGHFDGRQFDMMMSSRGRNSFRPRLTGTLVSAGRGTLVTGTVQRDRGVLLFLLLFLSMPVSLAANLLLSSHESGEWEPATLVFPAVLLLFVAGVFIAFAYETRRAVRALTALVDGESTSHVD